MKAFIATLMIITLAGCSGATRTFKSPTLEDRTVNLDIDYKERAPLVLPPDYKNPKLITPKNDPILSDWKKNDFRNYK